MNCLSGIGIWQVPIPYIPTTLHSLAINANIICFYKRQFKHSTFLNFCNSYNLRLYHRLHLKCKPTKQLAVIIVVPYKKHKLCRKFLLSYNILKEKY